MRFFLNVSLVVLILGCGVQAQSPRVPADSEPTPVPIQDPTRPEVKAEKKIIMAMFGAEWCHYCHVYLPEAQKELEGLDKATRDAIDFRVYVPTGKKADTLANDADSLAFAKSLKLWAVPYSDKKWAMYQYWISKSLALPGCAIVEMDGKRVLERFVGADVSFCAKRAAKEAAR
jgi:thiol-disulfide isomerase/thioredoxin